MIQLANLQEKMDEINGKPWSPIDIVTVNDQVIRLAYTKGEYHWHIHEHEDEMFYLLEGDLTIRMKNHEDIPMKPGQFVVVPKGEEHAPKSLNGGFVLLFEPLKTKSKGD